MGSANGQSYSVTYSPEKLAELEAFQDTAEGAQTPEEYQQVVAAFLEATKEDLHALKLSTIPSVYYNASRNTYHLKAGELILEDKMPNVLVERLLYSIELGISVEPLIKFYTLLLRNPNYSLEKAANICWYINQKYTDRAYVEKLVEEEGMSYDVALERATGYQTPITQEGLLACRKYATVVDYKYILDEDGNKQRVPRFAETKTINENTGEVTTSIDKPEFAEDYLFLPPVYGDRGDAFYCGGELGHFIKVGQPHFLEKWDMVNTNDHASCVKGLHCGNMDYVRNYSAANRKLLEVFVSPENIGAVVMAGDGAIRVKEYFVYNIQADDYKLRSIYHSSEYAKRTDAQWEKDRAEAIAAIQQKAAEKAQKAAANIDRLTNI